jgi:hypothetical protein
MGLQNRDGYPTLASEPFSEISCFGIVWQNCWKIVVKKAVATPSIRRLMVVMITALAIFQTGGFVSLSLWFLPHITGNGHHHAEVN